MTKNYILKSVIYRNNSLLKLTSFIGEPFSKLNWIWNTFERIKKVYWLYKPRTHNILRSHGLLVDNGESFVQSSLTNPYKSN